MRFEWMRAKGIGPFKDEVRVDFSAIDGKLVAICGPNGAGKSSLLELLAGAMFRQCPTRGPLSSLATARDAVIEVGLVNGSRHTLKHVVDAVSGKAEAIACDETGRPVTPDAKVRSFDAWAAKHLPPPEVLYASTFAAQGSGGFLELKAGERKAVLLRVLGIERLEALAERARECVRTAKSNLAVHDARVADERERASDPVKVGAEIDELVAKKAEAEQALAAARAACEEARTAEESVRALGRAAEEIRRRREDLTNRLEQAKRKRVGLEQRLSNNRGVLEKAEEIREAVETAKTLDGEIAALTATIGTAQAERDAAEREHRAVEDRLGDLQEQAEKAEFRAAQLRRLLADKALVDAAVAALQGLREDVEAAEVRVLETELEIENHQEEALHGAETRVENLRAGLLSIADGEADSPRELASETLDQDDSAASAARQAPARIERARANLVEYRAALAAARLKVAAAEKTAARAGDIAAAASELISVDEERARLAEAVQAATREAHAAFERSEGVLERKQTQETELAKRTRARRELDGRLKLAEPLAQAEARIAELEPQYKAVSEEIESVSVELTMCAEPPVVPPIPDVAGARERADRVDAELRAHESAIAVKEAQLAAARASEKRLTEMKIARRAAEDDLGEWVRLAEDLGRDGLQALEIDAAGPELTELVNDLLRTCVGSRWTVTIEASRLSSDGKKQLEGCEVRVLDTERGREGTAESLSGGERVLVGEAVSLALSMLACRRSGVQGPTLVRDESGAALDPVNARAYVAMLRRAADIVGASHVLFVSHSPEVQELADARIEIRDGRVRIAS